ncbi:MAG: recombinase family protein [Verrucomicrobiaceae bacterium]
MEKKSAVAYLRTSSAANVGADKDSDKRQLAAIKAFAEANGFEVVASYYDAAVSGADPVTERLGFMEMLGRLVNNGSKTILVESPDRFARDLAVQLAGHDMLKDMGIALIPATAPDFFTEDTPTAVLVRQVLGAIAQFEKASTVAKLAAARKRRREAIGKCEGRKSHAELRPDIVQMVKELRHAGSGRKPKRGIPSLRAIASKLATAGYVGEGGQPYNPKSIAAMLASRP